MIVEYLSLLKAWITDYQVMQFQMIGSNLRLNAPDWPDVNTFPHHKHLPSGVEASTEIEAAAIFTAIKRHFETGIPGESHA